MLDLLRKGQNNADIIHVIGVYLDLACLMGRCSGMAGFDWDFDRIT